MNHPTHHAKHVFLVLLHSLARISLGSRAQQQKSFRFERWPCDHLSRPAICIARTHAIAQRAQISLLQVSCRGDSSESVWKLDFSLTHWHYEFIVKGRLGYWLIFFSANFKTSWFQYRKAWRAATIDMQSIHVYPVMDRSYGQVMELFNPNVWSWSFKNGAIPATN